MEASKSNSLPRYVDEFEIPTGAIRSSRPLGAKIRLEFLSMAGRLLRFDLGR
jgi:hypothetical protein